jgi:sucrose-6-phosphate hydrolase SacC (GH32 family)
VNGRRHKKHNSPAPQTRRQPSVRSWKRRLQRLDVDTKAAASRNQGAGNGGFDPSFPGVHEAPLPTGDGVVHLKVLVDWSSVEVFGLDGQVLLTDQIFPDPSSIGIAAFATGGTATLRSLTVNQMRSAWGAQPGHQ